MSTLTSSSKLVKPGLRAGTKIGVWIDHKRAVIVDLNKRESERIEKIYSGIDPRKRIPGEGKLYTRMGSHYFTFEEKKKKKLDRDLKKYLKEVTEKIREADALVLMGPASTKVNLKNEMMQLRLYDPRNTKIITTGRLTENQIVAEVKKAFKAKQV